mmetsp:Transcript_34694/g.62482  ORF Transcript_34694/g.62482 Transcript_34694/m.62482 type:complete len:228 (-) Transcript_34694:119-802(-)
MTANAIGDDKIGVKSGIFNSNPPIDCFAPSTTASASTLAARSAAACGDASKNTSAARVTTDNLIAETGIAALGCFFINSSSCKYPMPNPIGCANAIKSPMTGPPAAPFNSIIATPVTAIRAGINFFKSKSVIYPRSLVEFTLINSATIATNIQLREQITHALLGVVVISPINCPKYPKATHIPQTNAPLAVSHDIEPFLTAFIDPGTSANAASENRATAYKDASTPG